MSRSSKIQEKWDRKGGLPQPLFELMDALKEVEDELRTHIICSEITMQGKDEKIEELEAQIERFRMRMPHATLSDGRKVPVRVVKKEETDGY